MQHIRSFFTSRSYIELDTPSLSPALIPDSTNEVFRAEYIDPWTDESKDVYLVPSHSYFLKKAVSAIKAPVFQLSKCWKNCGSAGRLSSPEFTLLEWYTPFSSCTDSAAQTEELISGLSAAAQDAPTAPAPENAASFSSLTTPFLRLSMDEAFLMYAGFALSDCKTVAQLAGRVRGLGIPEFSDNPFDDWPLDELFELILSQYIEPALPKDRGVFLMDKPSYVPSLAKNRNTDSSSDNFWKESWILYADGCRIAESERCETDSQKVRAFLEKEGKVKNATARVRHTTDPDFWKCFEGFPDCTETKVYTDRLIMLLARRKSIESILPFPFRLKTGYY